MFGMMEALLSFFRRQVGLRTDAASATGSLHAKAAFITEKPIIIAGTAIKSIQRGTLALSTAQTSNTATISAVNMDKAHINPLGVSVGNARDNMSSSYYALTAHQLVRMALTSSTAVTATRQVHSDREAIVSYEVIEYW